MKTRTIVAAAAAIGIVAAATSANALVVVSSAPGAGDPGPHASETYVIDFDDTLEAGVTFGLGSNYQLISGPISGEAAPPAGDTSNYLSVPDNGPSGTADMYFDTFLGGRAVSRFSFYWGSIDLYNTLTLLDKSGVAYYSISGGAIPPANGDQSASSTNRRVTFELTGADRNLGGLRFNSTSYAFESDTFSFAAVPEPTTWALMIGGFGAAGAMLRRRRTLTAA